MPYTLRMPEALDVEAIMRHFDDDLPTPTPTYLLWFERILKWKNG